MSTGTANSNSDVCDKLLDGFPSIQTKFFGVTSRLGLGCKARLLNTCWGVPAICDKVQDDYPPIKIKFLWHGIKGRSGM